MATWAIGISARGARVIWTWGWIASE